MKRTMITAVASAALMLPTLTFAQWVPATASQDKVTIEQRAGLGAKLVASVETRITPGRPYSAEAVTESLQVLGDGNRISRRTATRVFRDNEGRTRREQPGPAGVGETITIWDPVSSTSFMLDPSTKTAFQSGLLALKSPMPEGRMGGGGRGSAIAADPVSPGRTRKEPRRRADGKRRPRHVSRWRKRLGRRPAR